MAEKRRALEAEFTRAMFNIYEQARKLKPPYTPTAFRTMVTELGGKGAADRLLAGPSPSSGFGELFERGPEALKLSVEYLVLNDPWRQLFETGQLEVARSRLRKVGCELPADDNNLVVADVPLAEELAADPTYPEGAIRRIQINAYERNPEARARCIAVHGTSCVVCGFDFGETYGSEAAGFIHVHHLRPIAEVGRHYDVDPDRDLRPVCPNCHAVIHLGGECRSIDEVQHMLQKGP